VAERLGWHLLDSGALYRLVALAGAARGLAAGDESGHAAIAARLDARFEVDASSGERVLLDGRDVTDTVLDFGRAFDGKQVDIVLTQRRAQVNGGVSNDRGQPANDYVVVLFPDDEAEWTKVSSRFFASARPDQQGRFSINNLPPGRYLAAAVEYLEPGEDRNPETLARLRGSATAIDLPEGESRSVTLRMAR
jgi:hypothetical protein